MVCQGQRDPDAEEACVKRRFAWIYTLSVPGGGTWRGDCARWAAEAPAGSVVTRERTMWLGPAWPCAACATGTHR